MTREEKHQVTIRMTQSLYEKIKTAADIEERSVPQQIRYDIEEIFRRATITTKQPTKIYNISDYR